MTEEIRTRLEEIRVGKIPKGYKQTPSGIIPQDWHDVEMSDVTEEIKEYTGNKKYETLSISAGIGFVNQAEKFGREISGAQYAKYIVLHRGDFSYNKGNSNLYPQGCIYRLNDREEAAVPNVFESFRFLSLDGNYYEQLFVSGYLNKQLYSKINHGVRDDGLLNLTGKDFYSCHLPVPPLPEQQKIAEILMQYDKAITLQQCKIEEIKQLKKACLGKMFPGKGDTVPDMRFPGFVNPWEQRKLGEIAIEIVAGGDVDKDLLVQDGRYPVIANALSNDGIIGYYNSEYRIKAPAVTITGRGDVGHAQARSVDFTPVVRLLSIKSEHDIYFLENAINTLKIVIESTGVPQLTVPQLEKYKISLPKNLEEERIIGRFFLKINYLITLHQCKLKEMQTLKKLLMRILLTGIVRVKV